MEQERESQNNSYLVKSFAGTNDLPQVMQAKLYFNRTYFDKLVNIRVFIAGGAVRDYMRTGRTTKSDVDFFSDSRVELAKLVRVLRKEYQFKPYLITKNAIKGKATVRGKEQSIDIVKVLFSSMQSAIDSFDFTICCFAVSSNDFVFHPSAPYDLLAKRLVVNSLPFPLSTFQRLQKFVKRGYWICNGGMLEISKAMANIDWTSPDQNMIELYPDGSPRFVRFD